MSAISAFMVVRDAERQGYPFVEAAACALSACEELVICDGYSEDRTRDGLLALREAFGERVRLFRDRWPGPENRGAILATVTNLARRRCRGSHCLMVQANELLHEDAAAALRALPARYPQAEIIALPYVTLMGPQLVAGTDVRRRLFANIPDIVAVGDAFEVAGVLPMRAVPTVAGELPEPVYRYRALTPEGYVAKLRAIVPRTRLWALELELAERAIAAAVDVADFWGRVRDFLAEDAWIAAADGTGAPAGRLTTTGDGPSAAAHLRGRWRYDLDASIAWLTGHAAATAA